MADDSYVKEKQVRDLTTTMIGAVNAIDWDPGIAADAVDAAQAAGLSAGSALQSKQDAESARDEAVAAEGTFTAPAKDVLDGIMGGDVSTLGTATEAQRADTWMQAWARPLPQNMPVITTKPWASPVAPEILHQTYRVGGGDKHQPVDMEGDPKFRYDGTPSLDPSGADPNFVIAPLLPGGSSQSAYYTYSVATITGPDNTESGWWVRAGISSLEFMVYVDEKPISEKPQLLNVTSGQNFLIQLSFPTPASRSIRFEIAHGAGMAFRGIQTSEPDAVLTKPNTVGQTRFALLGDSYVGGSGAPPADGAGRLGVATYKAAKMLQAGAVWNFGVGASGYVAGGANSFISRVPALLASNPDVVLIQGSINDGTDGGPELSTAVEDVLSALAPVPVVYVTGPPLPVTDGDGSYSYGPSNARVEAATLAAGRIYLDPLVEPWLILGTQIRSDGAHPNAAGHKRMASRIHEGVLSVTAP